MKRLSKGFKAALPILFITLFGLGAGWWMTEKSEAQNPRRVANFGMFGITANQFARLNVTNVCTPTESCRTRTLRLSFIDANGSSCGGVDCLPMQNTVTVEPGRSTFFDLPGSLLVSGNNRVQIRAMVEDLGSPNGQPVPPPIIPTLEVVDIATAETVFNIPCYVTVTGCGGSNPFF